MQYSYSFFSVSGKRSHLSVLSYDIVSQNFFDNISRYFNKMSILMNYKYFQTKIPLILDVILIFIFKTFISLMLDPQQINISLKKS